MTRRLGLAGLTVLILATLLTAPAARAEEAPAATGPSAAQPAVASPTSAAAKRLGARAVELEYADGRGKARDMRGVMPSLYRGKWFAKRFEKKRRCIVRRESHGNYRSVSAKGLYRGAYQMNRGLAVGATYTMQREVLKEMGAAAAARVARLRHMPTHTWNRYWQDRAFWTIFKKGRGASHWRGGLRHC